MTGMPLLVLALTAGTVVERGAAAAPGPVGVVAPAGSRLADELRRELAAAQLAWVPAVAGERGWPGERGDLGALPYARGVVVGSNDSRLIVFARVGTSERVEIRFELRFDPTDRPARRRACLAVVEELRALAEPAPPPSSTGPEKSPEEEEPAASTASDPTPAARPAPPAAPAVLGIAPPPSLERSGPDEPWVMGAASTLDLDRRLGAAMVHLQFTWLIPVGERLAFRAQAMWPLKGTDLRLGTSDARTWTFGAAVGLQYLFAPEQARWRPFAGIAAGSQFLLTDTPLNAADVDPGRALLVPSANVRLQSGVRLVLTSRVQLLAELEATRDWLLQPSRLADYRESAANALALHISFGVLFEY